MGKIESELKTIALALGPDSATPKSPTGKPYIPKQSVELKIRDTSNSNM